MARKSRANNVLILSDAKNMMWKAGLYSRLSVEDGDDTEQNSIGNQKKIGRHYLADKTDIVLADTYSDSGCRTTAIPGRIMTAPVFAVFCMRYNQKESTALLLRIFPDWDVIL